MPFSRTGRLNHELRKLEFTPHVNAYALGSVMVHMGKTQVYCTVCEETQVPKWKQASGEGWLSAEYAMLPGATHTRNARERLKASPRSLEIQRLIGRSIRSMIDFKALGEKSLLVDCDILQADGGTRTAAINGASVAVYFALKRLNLLSCLKGLVAAVSVGLAGDQIYLDLDYEEDSQIGVDLNCVWHEKSEWIEIQGTGEQQGFSHALLLEMTRMAKNGIDTILKTQKSIIEAYQ